jgi:hypothetical protein
MSNRAHLQWVGDNDPTNIGLECPGDGCGVTGRLQHNLVLRGESATKGRQVIHRQAYPPFGATHAIFKQNNLRERAVYVQSYDFHISAPLGLYLNLGSLWAARQLRIRARSATGRVARAAIY